MKALRTVQGTIINLDLVYEIEKCGPTRFCDDHQIIYSIVGDADHRRYITECFSTEEERDKRFDRLMYTLRVPSERED